MQPGPRITGYRHDATGVRALFDDGREERGTILIGADDSFVGLGTHRQPLASIRSRRPA